jgi:hypothetical protein
MKLGLKVERGMGLVVVKESTRGVVVKGLGRERGGLEGGGRGIKKGQQCHKRGGHRLRRVVAMKERADV